jgi:hypothetical protein
VNPIAIPQVVAAIVAALFAPAVLLAQAAGGPTPSEHAAARVQATAQIEAQRQDAEQQARANLDSDAVAAIRETQSALKAITDNKPADALAAIERATGKLDILLARNPATAMIPVAAQVEIIDMAPAEITAIKALATAVEHSVDQRDFPAARVLLDTMTSEIRVRTFHLPLATYPAALMQSAKLLDQKKLTEAGIELKLAMNTLVIIDHATPLPIAIAQAAIEEAQAKGSQDKDGALRLLSLARTELDRAKHLGYSGNDPEYAALASSISNVEKQIKNNGETASLFSSLIDRVATFFKQRSSDDKKVETASK